MLIDQRVTNARARYEFNSNFAPVRFCVRQASRGRCYRVSLLISEPSFRYSTFNPVDNVADTTLINIQTSSVRFLRDTKRISARSALVSASYSPCKLRALHKRVPNNIKLLKNRTAAQDGNICQDVKASCEKFYRYVL